MSMPSYGQAAYGKPAHMVSRLMVKRRMANWLMWAIGIWWIGKWQTDIISKSMAIRPLWPKYLSRIQWLIKVIVHLSLLKWKKTLLLHLNVDLLYHLFSGPLNFMMLTILDHWIMRRWDLSLRCLKILKGREKESKPKGLQIWKGWTNYLKPW